MQVWLTALPAITGRSEEKLAAAATTRMLCELPALQVCIQGGSGVGTRNAHRSAAYVCMLACKEHIKGAQKPIASS